MFVLVLLCAYGICFGLMNDKAKLLTDSLEKIPLFKNDRGTFFKRLFSCSYCTGFHTGWMSFLLFTFFESTEIVFPEILLGALLYSFASSAFCYSLDVLLQWLER